MKAALARIIDALYFLCLCGGLAGGLAFAASELGLRDSRLSTVQVNIYDCPGSAQEGAPQDQQPNSQQPRRIPL